ncbi:ABC-F family ATP-binding cassette domain-containing protein [Jatrophihabitans sp. YIM 134969]
MGGSIEVNGVRRVLPDGRVLFDDVRFRVGEGAKAALVGANGAGKTTLLRIMAGDDAPDAGSVHVSGGNGRAAVMRQFIGSVRDETTVEQFLASLADPAARAAWDELQASELALMEVDDEPTQLRYAHAITAWGEAHGYDLEVLWDTVTVAALGLPFTTAKYREIRTLSGGEQKRLALELLLRGPEQVLLLDEPDNYLDVPGKRWLEERLVETGKTVLFVSHDRELLARVATRVVTVEGGTAWTHGGGWASYPAARTARHERMAELLRRWEEEHQRLIDLVQTLKVQAKISEVIAVKYRVQAARLERYEAAGPPPAPPEGQKVTMRLRGGRTGKRAIRFENLALPQLDPPVRPFSLELFFGERVALLGGNGAGKSHILRLLAGDDVPHEGEVSLGARVVPGMFAQTHAHPEWFDRTLVDLLWHGDGAADGRRGVDRGKAMAVLNRYGLRDQGDQTFATLSGGQQARFQVLLLELAGSTLLLLDEPTDNLDVGSADALEEGLAGFEGTVVAVTHDRWFARGFDRFLLLDRDGTVRETTEPEFGDV